MLLYAGDSPWRDLIFDYSRPLIGHVAHTLGLVVEETSSAAALIDEAITALQVPDHIPIIRHILPGGVQASIQAASHAHPYELVIFGRLNRPLERLLPVPRSKAIARHLDTSVLRVHRAAQPLRRILLASSGTPSTLARARFVARLAAPLNAEVTVLHVLSQQSLCFELIPDASIAQEDFPHSDQPEARILCEAVDLLQAAGIQAHLSVRIGPVIDEVLAEAASGDYELLAIGDYRPATRLDRMLRGNLTAPLFNGSPLPVLIVQTPPSDPEPPPIHS